MKRKYVLVSVLAIVLSGTAGLRFCRAAEPEATEAAPREAIVSDWMLQDHGDDISQCFTSDSGAEIESRMVTRVLEELPDAGKALAGQRERMIAQAVPGRDPRWRALYVKACEVRRARRLRGLLDKCRRIVFTKHYDLGGSHYAYTEGQSDAQAERHFRPGAALCLLTLDSSGASVRPLIEDPKGVIRDPDVSYDGKRILFAWKKSDRQDDYHLYEMEAETRRARQLTDGLGFADYEGAYLPNGDIIFNSTRCVQIVDCWWTEVSNLYTCDGDGKYLRRLSFDQVHTNFPTVLADGRVIYTRWDYSDRGQIYPQPLFQMNADGTAQTEFYGNNSWFPTTILHARGIPGTQKVMAVLSGHHCHQRGKLAILDTSRGQQEASGVQFIAPVRETKAARVDSYGQNGEQFQFPYPLNERQFLVTYDRDSGGNRRYKRPYGIYFMDVDGRRELLAWDAKISCNQPVPLAARKRPHLRPSAVDYGKKTGIYYVRDVYAGPGLKGVPRGTVKRLRVVALEFRSVGIGSNGNRGPAGGALVSTPVSINNGTWDVKKVLGSTPVYDDGSAMFTVPARTPVFFQLLDANSHVVQSMRTWSTLQPGETFSCVGCHEQKSDASPSQGDVATATRVGAKQLDPFYGPARGFSFAREIQPILNRHCIRCHTDRSKVPAVPSRPRKKTRPGKIPATASHSHSGDAISALSDGIQPKRSGDTRIPRFTWWSHKGTAEWVQYNFKGPMKVSGVKVYWFQDTGGCRVPESWRLLYKGEYDWRPVATLDELATERDKYVTVKFAPVEATALRIEVQLKKGFSGGILEWKVMGKEIPGGETASRPPEEKPQPEPTAAENKAFSLLDERTEDGRAKRLWSDSYLALTQKGRPNKVVNWLNAQSIPPMLPPYFAGAARSELISMLQKGHNDVKLSREEMDKLACWIDLLVPFCGDYTEANSWNDKEKAKYTRYQSKRERMEALERENIRALLKRRGG